MSKIIPISMGPPIHVAYDSAQGEIFVSGLGGVSVISDATLSILGTRASVGDGLGGLAYDSGKGEVWVANETQSCPPVRCVLGNTLTRISDAFPYNVLGTVTVGQGPEGVAYNGTGEIFVVNSGSSTVSVIDDSSNTVTNTISVAPLIGGNTISGVYDTGKGLYFEGNQVISDASKTVVGTVANLQSCCTDMAYDSGKGEIFAVGAGGQGGQVVQVISDVASGSTFNVVATIPVPEDIGFGLGVTYDSGKGEVYATNYGRASLPDYLSDVVNVISDTSNTEIGSVCVGHEPYGVAYDHGKGEIFVVDQQGYNGIAANSVSVINDSFTGKANSAIANFTVLPSSITIGQSVSEIAELFCGFGPTGTVTFNVFPNSFCSGTPSQATTKTIPGGSLPQYVNSGSISFNTAGFYSIQAEYSGDTNNNGSTSICEPITVLQNPTSLSVTCTPPSVIVNQTTHQSTSCLAIVGDSGSMFVTPSGNVSFTTSGAGSFSPAASCTIQGSGASARCSVTYTPTSVGAGVHAIGATYSGDTNHPSIKGGFDLTVNSGGTVGAAVVPVDMVAILAPYALVLSIVVTSASSTIILGRRLRMLEKTVNTTRTSENG